MLLTLYGGGVGTKADFLGILYSYVINNKLCSIKNSLIS